MINDYPAGPAQVPAALTQPSSAYKQRTWLALASLILFVLIYCALAGWLLLTSYRLISEALAGGESAFLGYLLGGCAVFLSIFMLKGLFYIQRNGAPDALEVTEKDQPRLFAFLHQLADEAGAPRPARVFVSARVNAAVFYDLSMINLLFPSRKNLEIGLALVNVLTLSEIKAVLAHEFGHFAQRSMAIGSWVYIAQQIASQLIHRRDILDKFLRGLSNTDPRIAWAGWLLSLIIWSIRCLMDTLLSLVVLAQRALSRQMEFQADLVAVSLTGSDELVHALHKLQTADDAWRRTLSFTDSQLRAGHLPDDLFNIQTRIIEKFAKLLDDEHYGKVPKLEATQENDAQRRLFKSSFAQPPQMWSTHPANADRENNAKQTYLAAPHDARSAWILFDNADTLKQQSRDHLLGKTAAQPVTAEQTQLALDDYYALQQFDPRYRGAYLGRALTRHAKHINELYDNNPPEQGLTKAMASLYSSKLAGNLKRLRDLNEECATLQALRDKVYKANGNKIVVRGREVARRQLPAAIAAVERDITKVREQIAAHDKLCRSLHLAIAKSISPRWHDYLLGLLSVLHYAEHVEADLLDAHGAYCNVLAVVTADGKVSKKEMKRLVKQAGELYVVLEKIHAYKNQIQLDTSLTGWLKVESWPSMLEEFKLNPPAADNMQGWAEIIDGWVQVTAQALASLGTAALEQLLIHEQQLTNKLQDNLQLDEPADVSTVAPNYQPFAPGQERQRQKRLHWWDRFKVADGLIPATARLIVAASIVGTVLSFGSMAGTSTKVTVYNGLGREIMVGIGSQTIHVNAFASNEIETSMDEQTTISARTLTGQDIENFKPQLQGHLQHYIYNVAAASPLVEWTAAYGNAAEVEPRMLGAQRWLTSNVDVYFAEPPTSVKTKGGGATRTVLSGVGNQEPAKILSLLADDVSRQQVILVHAKWDENSLPVTAKWQQLATLKPPYSSGK